MAAPAISHRLTLGEVLGMLVEDALIVPGDAPRLEQLAQRGRGELHPLVVVANQKIKSARPPHQPLSLEGLALWLAGRCGLEHRRIDPLKIDVKSVTEVVSHAYAARYRILPIEATGEKVVFATAEPFLRDWEADLATLLRKRVERVLVNPLDLNRYLMEFYGLSRSVRGATTDQETRNAAQGLFNFEQLWELGRSGELGTDDRPVVQVVDWLLQYAFSQRASDIHLEPRREQGNIRFRIDGVLHQVYQLPPAVMAAVVSRIKVLSRLDVAEKRRPQDGRLKTRMPSGREVELRISTMPIAFGEKCVLRIFDPDIVTKSFVELGFSPREMEVWSSLVEARHGIVLVTGPTGSGKTTTLYTTLKHLASPEINLCTVEDPIEMIAPEFNQMQVQTAIQLTFAQGIRTLLRQDPDVIMVGEIRDLETAQMAIQASLTGHLVLSTLHTNDAVTAVTRLLDLGVPHYLIQGTLGGVMAQRLVRTLCPHCKVETSVSEHLWEVLVHPWNLPRPEKGYAPRGCSECRQTGFLGRTGIYEVLTVTPELRRLIRPDPEAAALRSQALRDGMRVLRLSAAYQVAAGVTTLDEVLKVVPVAEVD